MILLYKSLVEGLIRHSIPHLTNISLTSKRQLQGTLNRCIRICLGLPRGSSGPGTVAEARCLPLEVLQKQEIVRIHLRHKTQHKNHYLSKIHIKRPNSSYGDALGRNIDNIPKQATFTEYSKIPPWTLRKMDINLNIPGILAKHQQSSLVMLQLVMSYIYETYTRTTHIYTDGSTTATTSSSAFFVPSRSLARSCRLNHHTSSTAAELHGIKEAIKYICQQPPQQWTLFTDSKCALQSLSPIGKKSMYSISSLEIAEYHHLAFEYGHQITFQWIPGHSGIRGNECADKSAKRAHQHISTRMVPFTKGDCTSLTRQIAKSAREMLWSSPDSNYKFLYDIDPLLTTRLPSDLPRNLETLVHRLRLNCAYTKNYRFKIKQRATPDCEKCGAPETIRHILLTCQAYENERKVYKNSTNALDCRPFDLPKLLGPWPAKKHRAALKALFKFLEDIDLLTVL